MIKYPVLHSGFVGHNDVVLTKTDYNNNPFVENLLFRQSGNNEFANLFYSEEVSEIYKQYQADNSLMKDIKFRERVLKLAAMLFGKHGLSTWLDIQNKYAKVSYSHLSFIIDLLRFLATGEREMSPAMWENLIMKTSTGANMELDKSEEARNYIKELKPAVDGYIGNILNIWVSHKGGYQDLLFTMWVIFGNKSYAHHVAVQKTGA